MLLLHKRFNIRKIPIINKLSIKLKLNPKYMHINRINISTFKKKKKIRCSFGQIDHFFKNQYVLKLNIQVNICRYIGIKLYF